MENVEGEYGGGKQEKGQASCSVGQLCAEGVPGEFTTCDTR